MGTHPTGQIQGWGISQQGRSRGGDSPNRTDPGVGTLTSAQVQGMGLSQQASSRGWDSPNWAGPGVGTLPTGQIQGQGLSPQGRSRGRDSPNRAGPGVGTLPTGQVQGWGLSQQDRSRGGSRPLPFVIFNGIHTDDISSRPPQGTKLRVEAFGDRPLRPTGIRSAAAPWWFVPHPLHPWT